MKEGLEKFLEDPDSISRYLYHTILGQQCKKNDLNIDLSSKLKVSASNMQKLNSSQINAVVTALTMPLCLIQGPPGTGKTVTSARIVY
jgi:regulator of nonsense transcripts 1